MLDFLKEWYVPKLNKYVIHKSYVKSFLSITYAFKDFMHFRYLRWLSKFDLFWRVWVQYSGPAAAANEMLAKLNYLKFKPMFVYVLIISTTYDSAIL